MARRPDRTTLFLCGDVMTGRGIDQVLRHPSPPDLYEPCVRDARDYVALAEAANGPVPRAVDDAYPWGDVLGELDRIGPDARVINLETSVTRSAVPAPKGINYRMHPGNVGVVAAVKPDACVLANNHVLDWGVAGLLETLDTLHRARLATAGAGRTLEEARRPAAVPLPSGGRLLVVATCTGDSGVPRGWAAEDHHPGVSRIHLADADAESLAALLQHARQPGDVAMVSIHWGSNWGYDVPHDHVRFAHRLVDAGVDVVHGHSSHHPRPVEVYRGRPILYGCGDFLNDYEGIRGYEEYRGDVTAMWLPTLDATGALESLVLVPMRLRRLRLQRAATEERRWLAAALDRACASFHTGFVEDGDRLLLRWG